MFVEVGLGLLIELVNYNTRGVIKRGLAEVLALWQRGSHTCIQGRQCVSILSWTDWDHVLERLSCSLLKTFTNFGLMLALPHLILSTPHIRPSIGIQAYPYITCTSKTYNLTGLKN